MRFAPHFFGDESNPADSSTDADASRFTTEPNDDACPGEESLRLPGLDSMPSPPLVSVRFGEILEPLADAIRSDCTFLSDFANDDVQLPADLLECLRAYGQLRRAA